MNNETYTKKILSSAYRILIDTSTLMTPSFQQFLVRNKEEFLATNQKIIVSREVYTEIARHLNSASVEKRNRAMTAVEILASNKDIFLVDSAPLTEEEIVHAFADAQLLSALTRHKPDGTQLLISNDRDLSRDAFDINQQQSCKKHKVFVCFINSRGELQCCDCARSITENKAEHSLGTDPSQTHAEAVHHSHVVTAREKYLSEKNTSSWKFDWKSGVLGILSISFFYGLLKIGNRAFSH